MEKDPERRLSIKQAMAHRWLTTSAGEATSEAPPVPQNLVRQKTAKAETLYEGCEIAKALTAHADEASLRSIPDVKSVV